MLFVTDPSNEVSLAVGSWLATMTVIATTVYVRPDGPYIVTGDFALDARGAPRDDASVVLCRCGRSSNKPYCDGTHTHIGFVDAAVLPASTESSDSVGAGRLMITPRPNGPLKCAGPLNISAADGRIRESHDVFLCRCGGSATKPFCDGTHKKIGFVG
jgi:CDGSH-type Zn-finger protein